MPEYPRLLAFLCRIVRTKGYNSVV